VGGRWRDGWRDKLGNSGNPLPSPWTYLQFLELLSLVPPAFNPFALFPVIEDIPTPEGRSQHSN
jgi:hypothetical protein